jgi:hypothetical protein
VIEISQLRLRPWLVASGQRKQQSESKGCPDEGGLERELDWRRVTNTLSKLPTSTGCGWMSGMTPSHRPAGTQAAGKPGDGLSSGLTCKIISGVCGVRRTEDPSRFSRACLNVLVEAKFVSSSPCHHTIVTSKTAALSTTKTTSGPDVVVQLVALATSSFLRTPSILREFLLRRPRLQ